MRLLKAPLRPLHEPDLALGDQRFGAGPGVAGHQREHHRERRHHHVIGVAEAGVEVDQADEQQDVGEAVDHRVPYAAELAQQAGLERNLAVDEVEDVGDDHDEPGPDEVPAGEVNRGPAVDQAADEGEDVRMDPETDAYGDDRAQRKHADAPDQAGKRHN